MKLLEPMTPGALRLLESASNDASDADFRAAEHRRAILKLFTGPDRFSLLTAPEIAKLARLTLEDAHAAITLLCERGKLELGNDGAYRLARPRKRKPAPKLKAAPPVTAVVRKPPPQPQNPERMARANAYRDRLLAVIDERGEVSAWEVAVLFGQSEYSKIYNALKALCRLRVLESVTRAPAEGMAVRRYYSRRVGR